MEIFTTIVSFLILGGLITSPFLILYWLNRRSVKYKLMVYLALGITTTAILTFMLAWWSYASDQILLSHYGYDFEPMNYTAPFENVKAENLDRVKSLETSMMGIGWPLKAIVTYALYSPYLLIAYLIIYMLKRNNKDNEHPSIRV